MPTSLPPIPCPDCGRPIERIPQALGCSHEHLAPQCDGWRTFERFADTLFGQSDAIETEECQDFVRKHLDPNLS